MADHLYKDSITGEFVSADYAAAHPATTYRCALDSDEAPHGCGSADEPPTAVNPDPEFDGDEGYPPEAA